MWYRAIMLVLGCFVLMTRAMAADHVEYGPPPDWVETVALPANDATMAQAPVKSLLLNHQVRFTATGLTFYTQSYLRVQTPQGLSALGSFALPWKPDSDVLTVHKFRLLRQDKIIDLLADGQKFEVLRRENNLEYSALDGILTAAIQPSGIEVGDILDVAFSIHRESRLLPFPELLLDGFNQVPLSHVMVRALWDKDVAMHWKATEEVKGIKETRAGGLVELRWEATGLAPIDQPKDVPLRFYKEPRVYLTSYATWNEVSKKLAPLFTQAATLAPDSPLKVEAHTIAAASSDVATRLEAVLRLAQERVRYVYLGMNDGGINPAAADLTWTRRFGDCKGKSALIIALLHELGIEAEPVAVNTFVGDLIGSILPSLASFNHVIVRAHAGGKTWWLDGAGAGSWRQADMQIPDYHWGLPVTARGDALIRMSAGPALDPQVETHTTIDARAGLHTDAPFHADTRFTGTAAAVLHAQLSALTPEAMDAGLREYWKKQYDFVEPKNVAADYDDATGVETLTLEGTADMDWSGDSYTTDGLYVGYHADFKRKTATNADAPFRVEHPTYTKVSQRIELPAVGNFSTRGQDCDVTLAGMRYTRHARIENRVFTGESIAQSVADEVTAADARAAEKQLNDIWRDRLEVVASDYKVTAADIAALRTRNFDDGANLIWRGNIFLHHGDYDAALADFDKAYRLDATDYAALANRGIANYWKRNYDPARADFTAVLAKDPNNAVALRGMGAVLNTARDWPGAIARLTESLKYAPGDIFALAQRAYANQNNGKSDEALADAAEALRVDPTYLDMYRFRMSILNRQPDKTAVLHEVKSMLAALPDNPAAQYDAAGVYDHNLQRTEALAAINKAIALAPTGGKYWMRAIIRAPEDSAGKLADLDAALALDPNLIDAQIMRAQLMSDSGNHQAAIDIYSAQLKKATRAERKRDLLTMRGIEYTLAGKKSDSDQDFAAALADDPESDVYNNFCWALAIAKVNLDAALAACEKAVSRYPKQAAFLDSKAYALLQLGRYDEAIAAYDAALALDPDSIESLYARGLAKQRRCNCSAGDADIKSAKALNPVVERAFQHNILND